MPIPSLKLASIGLGVSGVIVGTGFGINNYLNKPASQNKKIEKKSKTISKWLNEDNFELLKENEEDPKWKENWKLFIAENTSDSLPESWNFEDYKTKKNNQESVPTELKKKCISNSALMIENKKQGEYEKVKKYCAKEKTKNP